VSWNFTRGGKGGREGAGVLFVDTLAGGPKKREKKRKENKGQPHFQKQGRKKKGKERGGFSGEEGGEGRGGCLLKTGTDCISAHNLAGKKKNSYQGKEKRGRGGGGTVPGGSQPLRNRRRAKNVLPLFP